MVSIQQAESQPAAAHHRFDSLRHGIFVVFGIGRRELTTVASRLRVQHPAPRRKRDFPAQYWEKSIVVIC
jgi:hypothetical protein